MATVQLSLAFALIFTVYEPLELDRQAQFGVEIDNERQHTLLAWQQTKNMNMTVILWLISGKYMNIK